MRRTSHHTRSPRLTNPPSRTQHTTCRRRCRSQSAYSYWMRIFRAALRHLRLCHNQHRLRTPCPHHLHLIRHVRCHVPPIIRLRHLLRHRQHLRRTHVATRSQQVTVSFCSHPLCAELLSRVKQLAEVQVSGLPPVHTERPMRCSLTGTPEAHCQLAPVPLHQFLSRMFRPRLTRPHLSVFQPHDARKTRGLALGNPRRHAPSFLYIFTLPHALRHVRPVQLQVPQANIGTSHFTLFVCFAQFRHILSCTSAHRFMYRSMLNRAH